MMAFSFTIEAIVVMMHSWSFLTVILRLYIRKTNCVKRIYLIAEKETDYNILCVVCKSRICRFIALYLPLGTGDRDIRLLLVGSTLQITREMEECRNVSGPDYGLNVSTFFGIRNIVAIFTPPETITKTMKKVLKLFSWFFMGLLMLSGCASNNNDSSASLDELFQSRRSIRAYEPDKEISEAEVRELLAATQNAPSWANYQPTRYYVVLSRESRDAVLELIGSNKNQVANASVLMVSTYENGKSGFFQGRQSNEIGDGWGAHDNGLSDAYLVLKARDMGFDTLIMGMRDSDGLRELFDIPETETVMAVIALGYRAQEPRMPVHKSLEEFAKFF